MSVSTDAMYNASSRYLHEKYIIHFPGIEPLEVTKSNFLISGDVLEESYKTSASPFGDVTSNELELSLFNEDKMFSPGNESSPYYGKIKRGVKIEAFIRPDEVTDWDPLGVFYVTSWSVASAGTVANITANDSLYAVLNAPVPSMIIYRNVTFSQFITDFFSLFNVSVTVDSSIRHTLPYVFTSGYSTNKELLLDLLTAVLADCYCDHTGNIVIRGKVTERPLRVILTDSDQLISVAVKQSIETDYDSATVTYAMWQESSEKEILTVKDMALPAGITTPEPMNFSSTPVVSVHSLRAAVKPRDIDATTDHISVTLQSSDAVTTDLTIIGTTLDKVESVISTAGNASVDIKSNFIQSKAMAESVCSYADAYVKADVPTLDIVLRGNPKLALGDKVRISSAKYAIEYTGVITKANYKYSGSLSCDISLVAAQV